MRFKYIYFQFVASLICKLSLPATATKTKQLLNLPAPQVQRSLSLTYRILCIWIGIWIRQWNWDRDWEWHLDWVGCTCMQLDKYAFGSNYTAKTGEPLPSLRMLIGGRQDRTGPGQVGQCRRSGMSRAQLTPIPLATLSGTYTDTPTDRQIKSLYNYAAWKCYCQLPNWTMKRSQIKLY